MRVLKNRSKQAGEMDAEKSVYCTNLWQEVVLAECCNEFGVSFEKEKNIGAKTFWILKGHPINVGSAMTSYFDNLKIGRPTTATDEELLAAKKKLFPVEKKTPRMRL